MEHQIISLRKDITVRPIEASSREGHWRELIAKCRENLGRKRFVLIEAIGGHALNSERINSCCNQMELDSSIKAIIIKKSFRSHNNRNQRAPIGLLVRPHIAILGAKNAIRNNKRYRNEDLDTILAMEIESSFEESRIEEQVIGEWNETWKENDNGDDVYRTEVKKWDGSLKVHKNTCHFCLTHKEPIYSVPRGITNIIDIGTNNDFESDIIAKNVLGDFECWEEMWLGECGVLCAAEANKRYKGKEIIDRVVLSYYRKFVSVEKHGPECTKHKGVYITHADNLDMYKVYDQCSGKDIGTPIDESFNVYEQYSSAHCQEDWEAGIRMAVESGVLTKEEADELNKTNKFIHWAHGSCSLSSKELIEIGDKMKKLHDTCMSMKYISPLRDKPYQKMDNILLRTCFIVYIAKMEQKQWGI